MDVMAEWWSVEVFHGEFQAASRWKDTYGSALTESAVSAGAIEWVWIEHRYGVVFEVCFPDDARWEVFRAVLVVQSALDAVPDPVNGLLVYRGRGGGSGARKPRRPRPTTGAGAVELPDPVRERVFDLVGAAPPAGPGGREVMSPGAVAVPAEPVMTGDLSTAV